MTSFFFPSEQETPDGSQEKPRRRKKPKTPEPKVGGDSARENLGFQNDAAMEGDEVSTCKPLFRLLYRSVSLVSTPVYPFPASRGLSSLVFSRSFYSHPALSIKASSRLLSSPSTITANKK